MFQRNGAAWDQQDKLVPGDGAAADLFGVSVDISGTTAIVGSRQDNSQGEASGSAYIFRRDGEDWVDQVKLVAPDGAAHDYFGVSVAISGETAIVGANGDDEHGDASGSAYIFTAPELSGLQSVTTDRAGNHLYGITPEENALVVLEASDLSLVQTRVPARVEGMIVAADSAAWDDFGRSVAVSGDWAIVLSSVAGSAHAIWLGDEGWGQQTKLLAEDGTAWDRGGACVAMYGDWAIVGLPSDENDGTFSGSAFMFRRDGEMWVQKAKLVADDGAEGDRFGCTVAISGDTAIVGACQDDDRGDDSGSAYVFRLEGDNWVWQGKLLANDGTPWDHFGHSVAASGDWAIVGTPGANSAYMFWLGDENFGQQIRLDAEDTGAFGFGHSVAISGDTAIVAAYVGPAGLSGSVFIFQREDTGWVQQARLVADDQMEEFGCSVAISGDTAVVGAQGYYREGSAYVFRRENGGWVQWRQTGQR